MSSPKKPAKDLRASDLAMIHVAAKSLFGDTSKNGDGRAEYEAWLLRHTGKCSAGTLTREERASFVTLLRRQGLLKERGAGGVGQNRPTSQQWAHLGQLAREMGWEKGLEDPRLKGFVERTAKVSAARFITREQASAVITGLRKWLAQKAGTEGSGHAVP